MTVLTREEIDQCRKRAYRVWGDMHKAYRGGVRGSVAMAVMTNLDRTGYGLTVYVRHDHDPIPTKLDGVQVRTEFVGDPDENPFLTYAFLEGHLTFMKSIGYGTGNEALDIELDAHIEVCPECRRVHEVVRSMQPKTEA